MQLLECLQRDTPGTRAKLAGDPACLGVLEDWVLDLLQDKLAFHVLETLLKVMPRQAFRCLTCCSLTCRALSQVFSTRQHQVWPIWICHALSQIFSTTQHQV